MSDPLPYTVSVETVAGWAATYLAIVEDYESLGWGDTSEAWQRAWAEVFVGSLEVESETAEVTSFEVPSLVERFGSLWLPELIHALLTGPRRGPAVDAMVDAAQDLLAEVRRLGARQGEGWEDDAGWWDDWNPMGAFASAPVLGVLALSAVLVWGATRR